MSEYKFTYDDCVRKLEGKPNHETCISIIFQWVKQDKINPKLMEQMVMLSYKKFNYQGGIL